MVEEMEKEKDKGSEWARAKQRRARGRKSSRQLDGLPGSTFHSSNEKITKDVSLQWVSGICRVSLPLSSLSISLSLWNPFSFDYQRESTKTSNLHRFLSSLLSNFILKREESSHIIHIVAFPDWLIWHFRYIETVLQNFCYSDTIRIKMSRYTTRRK